MKITQILHTIHKDPANTYINSISFGALEDPMHTLHNNHKAELYRLAVLKGREFTKACRTAKVNFFKDQLLRNKSAQRTFWKTINDLLGSKIDVRIEKVFRYNTDIYF